MSWLDFIGNIGNKIKYANAPQIPALQMAENGGLDAQKTLELALAQPKTLGERLGGRTVNVDFESSNPETGEIEVNRVSKYQPGLLNDIRSGARENFATGFAAPNWEQTVTPDGRKKGLGYRFGEGLGSFARFAESPLGRGLLMAGIVGASGGSGLEALGYGTGAGLLNQQSRMKDKMYRNELEKMGFDTTDITGYVGDDTFNKIYQSKQLQDNAEYRNAMLASQQRNQMLANKLAEDRLEYQKVSDAADRALKSRGLDIQERNIQKGTQKFRTAIGDKDGALQQIQEMKALVKANPKATGYIVGKFAKGQEAGQKFANEFLSRNPEAIKTRAAIAKLRGTTMHDLAGTAQTLQEQRNLAPFLPDATDNAQTILAKLEQLEKELLREKQTLVNTGYELGFDYDNTQPKQQTTTNEGWAF